MGHGPLVALGLMSGTSLDGIDAAIVRTDGRRIVALGASTVVPYYAAFRARLRAILGATNDRGSQLGAVVKDLTVKHAAAVRFLLASAGIEARDIDVIGFHGHTILHRPRDHVTRQIGDGALLAKLTGIPVVNDFRTRDVAEGGQGAPLTPLFHAALGRDFERPYAVLNIGGIANVTWVGATVDESEDQVIAFDTGPGNALIDDWMQRTVGKRFDASGSLARQGRARPAIVRAWLRDPYFDRPPPKSLDRGDFDLSPVARLGPADGAATLTAFTAAAIARCRDFLPSAPRRWLVGGGGRRNPELMAALAEALRVPVAPVEDVGWDGDVLEAQAFAFLAVRSVRSLPISLPSTTGVRAPMCGGILHAVPEREPPA